MQYTPEMKQLAEAVLADKDVTTVAALCDCVRENLNYPDTRFTVAHVMRLEELLRRWRKLLLNIEELTRRSELETKVLFITKQMRMEYALLERDCYQLLERHLC